MNQSQGRVTLWGVEVFLAVADEHAISAAAKRLGVSPSAISQQLTGLEAALNAVLLDRSARPMRLTPAGSMFLRHAQAMMNAQAEAHAELALSDMSGLTTLRLGMIEDFDAEVTPRLLSSLSQDLKGCRFLLETGASHRLLDQLDARALDMVAAADLGSETPDDISREVYPLLQEPFLAVVPKGQSICPDLPLIQYTARHLMGRQIAGHLARHNIRLAHRFELDSYNAIMAMIADGRGWSILTPLALHHASRFRDQVDVRPLPYTPLERTLSLSARPAVLQDMPAKVASRLRLLIAEQVVEPALAQYPWLAGKLRVF
jgi:DNA-binding transcriptional LysR family regulator